jgi:hypothetical protein
VEPGSGVPVIPNVCFRPILLKNSKSQARQILPYIEAINNLTGFASEAARDVLHRDINSFMFPPRLKRASRLITPKIFHRRWKKEFFNRIGHEPTFRGHLHSTTPNT